MPPLTWLNKLLLVENLSGIYRNYCSQKKNKKCFIIFLILILTMFHTILLITQVYYLLRRNDFYSMQINLAYSGYAVSAFITAMSSIISGICYSHAFQSYLRGISRVSETFKEDEKLINSLKKMYWLSITLILYILIVFGILRSMQVLMRYQALSDLLIVGSMMASQSILRITILYQHLMFFVVIMIIFHLSKCLTLLISAVQERVGFCDISTDEQCDITREQIQGWIELYRDLANCCDKVTLCFGRQFFFSLITCLVYYVMLVYQICYINPFYIGKHEETPKYKLVIIIVGYGSVLIMPLIAGQKTSNQGVKFHRMLVRLYNKMMIDSSEANAKLIKDFIRLIKKNPIEIRLLSKIPAGMYMLPVMLTLTVNSLIIMLQFMHII